MRGLRARLAARRARPYALGSKLSRQFALQTLLGLGFVCVAVYGAAHWALATRADEEMVRKTALVRLLLQRAVHDRDHDFVSLGVQLDTLFRAHTDIALTVKSTDGSLSYRSVLPDDFGALQVRESRFTLDAPWIPGGSAQVVLRMDQSPDERLLDRLAWSLAIVAVGGSAVIAAGGFLLVRRGLAPMRDLALQTRALTVDRLDQRLSTARPSDEMQPWIEQVNALLGRLDVALKQAESFNADVAHELRTPLTVLIGETELMLTGERSPDALRDTLESNLEELRRLAGIVSDMLFLSRADRGAVARRGAPASLAAEVAAVAEFHEATLEERQLQVEILGDCSARYDSGLLRRALSNLLSNATRYADAGSTIAIHIAATPGGAGIEVRNTGPGIPADQCGRVFDRFFRLETSREGGGDGHHGLGLAIVAAIMRMHGGRAEARSGQGTTAIRLQF